MISSDVSDAQRTRPGVLGRLVVAKPVSNSRDFQKPRNDAVAGDQSHRNAALRRMVAAQHESAKPSGVDERQRRRVDNDRLDP